MSLPFAPAAERNRGPIGEALDAQLARGARVLEIGAGTGQHAEHVAARRPDVSWLATDRAERLGGIVARVGASGLPNLETPAELDLLDPVTHDAIALRETRHAVFAANVLHIAPLDAVAALFGIAGHVLVPGGVLCVYGPLRIEGAYDGPDDGHGNRAFDAMLQAESPARGLRELNELDAWAAAVGLARIALEQMPANNRWVVWRKAAAAT